MRTIPGAVARPKDGVQHPDLDAAWTEYDKQIETAAKAIEQAIERELSKAAEAGDLDAALKWKTAGEQFKKAGRIPEGMEGTKPQGRPKPRPTKQDPSQQSLVVEAQGRLEKVYEAVEKELVKSLDLEKAKQVRSERESLAPVGGNSAPAPLMVVIEAKNYKAASPNAAPRRDGFGVATREGARWDNLTIPADNTLLWDVALPQQGNFFVHVLYASEEARPCDVIINGKVVARTVLAGKTGGFMRRDLKWETLGPVSIGPRSELATDPQTHGPHLSRIVISSDGETPDKKFLAAFVGSWKNDDNKNLEEIRADGAYIVNRDPRNEWSGTWVLDTEDPKGPCVVRHSNNRSLTRWYVDPADRNSLVAGDGVRVRRVNR